MSGANGVGKFAHWNRENQLSPLQSVGTRWSEANMNLGNNGIPQPTVTSSPLTPLQLLSDWVFTALTPNSLVAPNHNALNTLFEQTSHYKVGNSFTVEVTNFDQQNKTLAFGTGYQVNPNPLVIPLLSKGYITIELVGIPCQFEITNIDWGVINNTNVVASLTPAGVLPVGNNPGDLLEWDGTAWNPTDPTLNNTTPALLNRISPFPNPTLAPFQELAVESGLVVNALSTTPAVPIRPFNGNDEDTIESVAVPQFNLTNQAGVLAKNASDYDAQDATLIGSSMFISKYNGLVNNFAPLGTPNSLWHYLGITNNLPFGMDIGGQMFSTSFNVISDRGLKKNIEPIALDSRMLRKLEPSLFHMNYQRDEAPRTLGLIAQDVQMVIPEAVAEYAGHNKNMHINTMPLITALLAYAKDLENRVTELEKKIN